MNLKPIRKPGVDMRLTGAAPEEIDPNWVQAEADGRAKTRRREAKKPAGRQTRRGRPPQIRSST
jgi:hypothetical protein